MDITIHASFLPHDDPEASLAFYRDMSIVLDPPGANPGITDDERRTIAEMIRIQELR